MHIIFESVLMLLTNNQHCFMLVEITVGAFF